MADSVMTTFTKLKVIVTRLITIALLILPPVGLCVFWYFIDSEERRIFSNLEVRGGSVFAQANLDQIANLATQVYNDTKDNNPVRLGQKKEISELTNFKTEVSKRFTEEIGVFAALPLHRACLKNRNKISVNGIVSPPINNTGATGIIQKDGYNFYAKVGENDCKSVVVGKFRESTTTMELVYPLAFIRKGNDTTVSMATSSVDTSETLLTVSLSWWALGLAFFFLLPAWSVVFFQYKKILQFIF